MTWALAYVPSKVTESSNGWCLSKAEVCCGASVIEVAHTIGSCQSDCLADERVEACVAWPDLELVITTSLRRGWLWACITCWCSVRSYVFSWSSLLGRCSCATRNDFLHEAWNWWVIANFITVRWWLLNRVTVQVAEATMLFLALFASWLSLESRASQASWRLLSLPMRAAIKLDRIQRISRYLRRILRIGETLVWGTLDKVVSLAHSNSTCLLWIDSWWCMSDQHLLCSCRA